MHARKLPVLLHKHFVVFVEKLVKLAIKALLPPETFFFFFHRPFKFLSGFLVGFIVLTKHVSPRF